MDKISYLSQHEYFLMAKKLEGGHWTPENMNTRWDYHYRTIELAKSMRLTSPQQVLEMGTMGICCVKNSDTLDYDQRWNFPGKNPTYLHDAKNIPWPVESKKYELFIALRVFQHLAPFQNECFKEAVRVSKRVIIVVPEVYNVDVFPMSKGISYSEFVKFFDGVHPNLYLPTAQGMMYYWDTENASKVNLEKVMESIQLIENRFTYDVNNTSKISVTLSRVANKLKNMMPSII